MKQTRTCHPGRPDPRNCAMCRASAVRTPVPERIPAIIYVVPNSGRCGGNRVIAEHVAGLNARGHNAVAWGLTGDFSWFDRPVSHSTFPDESALMAALVRTTPKTSVATYYVSNEWVAGTLRPGDRGLALTQDLDESVYGNDFSGRAYRYPLRYLTESDFVRDELKRIHGVDSVQIGIGIDHRTFRYEPRPRDRFQILTPYRPTMGPVGLKGWDIATDVLERVASLEPRATLTTFGIDPAPEISFMRNTHVQTPTDDQLRELYLRCGVFLSPSRREGFNLPALEAMACRAPVVCTDAGGNREYARHRETASVHDTADVDGMAAAIVGILNDPTAVHPRTENGYNVAQRYRWDRVITNLEKLIKPA